MQLRTAPKALRIAVFLLLAPVAVAAAALVALTLAYVFALLGAALLVGAVISAAVDTFIVTWRAIANHGVGAMCKPVRAPRSGRR